nr:hypothetical protein RSP597_18995 [Ralstonia solanacearum]
MLSVYLLHEHTVWVVNVIAKRFARFITACGIETDGFWLQTAGFEDKFATTTFSGCVFQKIQQTLCNSFAALRRVCVKALQFSAGSVDNDCSACNCLAIVVTSYCKEHVVLHQTFQVDAVMAFGWIQRLLVGGKRVDKPYNLGLSR